MAKHPIPWQQGVPGLALEEHYFLEMVEDPDQAAQSHASGSQMDQDHHHQEGIVHL
jgi:hypothetical protein